MIAANPFGTNVNTQPQQPQKINPVVDTGARSPNIGKKNLDFNFEDAWKAEGTTSNPSNGVRPNQNFPSNNPPPKNPMMNPTQPINNPTVTVQKQ